MSTRLPSARQRLLDRAGSVVDAAFLAIPTILFPLADGRRLSPAAYEKEIRFYIDNGYCDHPLNFFEPRRTMPEPVVIEQHPYGDGIMDIVAWQSGYIPKNPHIRPHWNGYRANRTAYLVRWRHGNRGNKTVLCLHGFMLGEPRQAERMFRVAGLFDQGLDVALSIAPFHWRRAGNRLTDRGAFLQPHDVCMTAEASGQTRWDLHSAFRLMEADGAAEIGLIGASLGGFNAALFSCLSDAPAFCALMVPAVRFPYPLENPLIKKLSPMPGHVLDQARRVWAFSSPLHLTPVIDREKILMVASRGDLLCPWRYTRQLAERWDGIRSVSLTGGHWLIFDRKERGRAWYELLAACGFIPPE